MLKKITLPIFCILLVTSIEAQNNIGLFDECYYKGTSAYLVPGSYRASGMGLKNDKISAMQIPKGMRVTVYTDDNFKGNSLTFTSDVECLPSGMNDNVSSIVVESIYNNQPGYGQDYITFSNDCNGKGYSQSLKPGTYSANKLGSLKLNISSFLITGNLQVKVYTGSDNASGYSTTFTTSESCLSSSFNDKIRSLKVEYRTGSYNNYPNNTYPNNNNGNNNNYPDYGGSGSFATVYTSCNYAGNSLRLGPGNYSGEKLGLMKYNISSMEIPSNLRAKVFINNEYTNGTSYIISENTSCFSSTINDRIGSIIIEEKGTGGWNNNTNNYPNNNYPNNNNSTDRVTLYSDANFKGLSATILPGTYNSMEEASFTTQNLSSIYIPAGYKVIIYEQLSGNGKNKTLTESQSSLSSIGWNDKAASIKVIKLY